MHQQKKINGYITGKLFIHKRFIGDRFNDYYGLQFPFAARHKTKRVAPNAQHSILACSCAHFSCHALVCCCRFFLCCFIIKFDGASESLQNQWYIRSIAMISGARRQSRSRSHQFARGQPPHSIYIRKQNDLISENVWIVIGFYWTLYIHRCDCRLGVLYVQYGLSMRTFPSALSFLIAFWAFGQNRRKQKKNTVPVWCKMWYLSDCICVREMFMLWEKFIDIDHLIRRWSHVVMMCDRAAIKTIRWRYMNVFWST